MELTLAKIEKESIGQVIPVFFEMVPIIPTPIPLTMQRERLRSKLYFSSKGGGVRI